MGPPNSQRKMKEEEYNQDTRNIYPFPTLNFLLKYSCEKYLTYSCEKYSLIIDFKYCVMFNCNV